VCVCGVLFLYWGICPPFLLNITIRNSYVCSRKKYVTLEMVMGEGISSPPKKMTLNKKKV
jgi:hypothetical protein